MLLEEHVVLKGGAGFAHMHVCIKYKFGALSNCCGEALDCFLVYQDAHTYIHTYRHRLFTSTIWSIHKWVQMQ